MLQKRRFLLAKKTKNYAINIQTFLNPMLLVIAKRNKYA
jgi:hypothetical protein